MDVRKVPKIVLLSQSISTYWTLQMYRSNFVFVAVHSVKNMLIQMTFYNLTTTIKQTWAKMD